MILIDSKAPAWCFLLVKGFLRLIFIWYRLHFFAILDGELLETADDLFALLQIELRPLVVALLCRSLLHIGNSLSFAVFLELFLLSGYFVIVGFAGLQLISASFQIPHILLAVIVFLSLLVAKSGLGLVNHRQKGGRVVEPLGSLLELIAVGCAFGSVSVEGTGLRFIPALVIRLVALLKFLIVVLGLFLEHFLVNFLAESHLHFLQERAFDSVHFILQIKYSAVHKIASFELGVLSKQLLQWLNRKSLFCLHQIKTQA